MCHRASDTHDYMWTTPQRLYIVLDTTLKAYEQVGGSLGHHTYTS
jgi:hypothetical protein